MLMAPNLLSNLTIVVVEDHDDVRDYLGIFFRQMGANVLLARDAKEGLAAIVNGAPDLVVSDISMPGHDGFSLLADIRALEPEAGGCVPVIAMSALLGRVDQGRLLKAGFQAYLPKPFGPAKLMKTILAVLER
jgi:DNA-binding response OmpR family regulator